MQSKTGVHGSFTATAKAFILIWGHLQGVKNVILMCELPFQRKLNLAQCFTLLALLSFRLLSEDVGMDVPFEEGMRSPSAADMRPGEGSMWYCLQWYSIIQ